MLNFGAGALFGVRTDITGQSPFQFGALQDVTWDLQFTEKELMGAFQFPLAVARANAKFAGKAKLGVIDAKLLNSLFFGQAISSGQTLEALNEAQNVPGSVAYTVTATHSSTFVSDLGVSYAGGLGLPLTNTASVTASGQYSVASGTYTFSSSDASAAVWLNYLYTVTTGEQITITNQLLGTTPTFRGVFVNRDPQTGLLMTFKVNKMTCSKLTLGSKTADFTIPEMDLTIMDDGTGNIGVLSFGDAS